MIENCLRYFILYVEVRDRQERHIQHVRRGKLTRMVGLANQRRINRANSDAVQIFLTLRQLLAVIEFEIELAAGALFHRLVNELQAFRKRTALAPKRNSPGHLRAIHHLRFRRANRRGNTKRKRKSTSRNRRR